MKVGDYEILRRIGSGAYGKVYLARKGERDGFRTYYALKRLHIEHAGDEAFERYLLREARHGGLVNHRALVRIHDVIRIGPEFVLVMDYVDGLTLGEVLAPRRDGDAEPIPAEVAMEIAAEVLEALHSIHTLVDPEGTESAFVHRDVKPGNIMLTRTGGLKLMDFGVARGDDAEHATQTGELRGTIAYMSPEQAAGKQAGPASDQFGAGLVLLEMLTGTPAWGDPKGLGILGKVVEGDVSEGLVRLAATDPVAAVLMRMLAPLPGSRFPDSGAAALALRELRAKSPTPPALPGFVDSEADKRADALAAHTDDAPSWTDSEGDNPALTTWTGEGALRGGGLPPETVSEPISEPPAELSPEPAPDLDRTLPIGSGQVMARDLQVAAAREASRDALPPVAAPPPPRGQPTQPLPAVPPGAAVRPPPSPGGQSQSHPAMGAQTAPIPSPIPGGPLPPAYAKKPATGPKQLDGAGGNALGIGLAALLILLLLGVVAVAIRPVGPAIQEIDPMAGKAPAPQPPADPATPPERAEPILAPSDSELPGVAEMLIEDDESEEAEAREDLAVAADEAGLNEVREAAPAPEPTPRREPIRTAPSERSGRVVADETPPPASSREPLPGAVVGGDGTRDRRAPRRAEDLTPESRSESTPAPSVAAVGPSLKFLSARQQPLGVPLSLRVRPEGFLANDVKVYYQWRSEGSSGRRKRSLRSEGDGSFALDIPASELKTDRLQVWFVAEPGAVAAGSSSRPIEVKVR